MPRTANNIIDEVPAARIRSFLKGLKCWYGYAGIGNTFQIALGRKTPRDPAEIAFKQKSDKRLAAKGYSLPPDPLRAEWDKFEGESNLLVWCSWRLDGIKGPITNPKDKPDICDAGIRRLIGQTVSSVHITPGWGLQLEFSGELTLSIFPDNVGSSADIDTNWELFRSHRVYFVGTDLICQVTYGDGRPIRRQPKQGRWKVNKAAKVLS